jgi:branched-chain amino acid transport system ATP-binding protein
MVSYGPVNAVRGVSFNVPEGAVIGLIGPNGAGKTSIVNAISGLVAYGGTISYKSQDLGSRRPWARSALGIGHVPQGRRIFGSMTIEDNLHVGAPAGVTRRERESRIRDVYDTFPRLRERQSQRANQLSGGEQQMLALGRGLMGRPQLLLLDEPTLGLAPALADDIFAHLMQIRSKDNLTILLVEQRVVESLEFCDHVYVIEQGRVAMEGSASTLLASDDIQQRYLGLATSVGDAVDRE